MFHLIGIKTITGRTVYVNRDHITHVTPDDEVADTMTIELADVPYHCRFCVANEEFAEKFCKYINE